MPRTALLFPGQGAQSVGMAGTLYRDLPAAKSLFDQASQLLGFDLIAVCVGGPAERLNSTDVSQLAIFVANLAALESLKQTVPEAVNDVVATAGLSLGEYSALVFAGAMSFEDGVKVVKARGEAMQSASNASPGGMVSVLGLEVNEVESLVAEAKSKGIIEVANRLCPGNTAVSGSIAAIEKLEQICAQRGGIRTIRLTVAGAFHTTLMKPADDLLAEALAKVTLSTPMVPVWSNVDAKPHTDIAEFKPLLVKQILSPVLWEETMRGMLDTGVERFYELGPGRVLAGLLKRVQRKVEIHNISA